MAHLSKDTTYHLVLSAEELSEIRRCVYEVAMELHRAERSDYGDTARVKRLQSIHIDLCEGKSGLAGMAL